MANDQQLSYCADMVRRLDKDRFLTALFAPEPGRSHLMALYAFNLEIARTREQVSEPMIGEIRLQWWRDALDAIYQGTPPEHEVAQALAQAIQETGLGRDPLNRLIDARSFDLYDEPMQTTGDLIQYVKDTSSALMWAGAAMLTRSEDADISTLVDKAGVAWGLTGLLRALPIHIERHQQLLPTELLERHGLSWSDFSQDADTARIRPIIADVSQLVRDALGEVRLAPARSAKLAIPALMPATLAESYLKQIQKSDFNPCTSIAEVPVFRKQLTMIKCALLGRI